MVSLVWDFRFVVMIKTKTVINRSCLIFIKRKYSKLVNYYFIHFNDSINLIFSFDSMAELEK